MERPCAILVILGLKSMVAKDYYNKIDVTFCKHTSCIFVNSPDISILQAGGRMLVDERTLWPPNESFYLIFPIPLCYTFLRLLQSLLIIQKWPQSMIRVKMNYIFPS